MGEFGDRALIDGREDGLHLDVAPPDADRHAVDLSTRVWRRHFGTGHSSSSYLKRCPIDTLKIDRSFVRDLTTDADDASIVTAVINVGKSLHMGVVAEGVETREQLAFLREQRCPEGKGYYFSRPVVAEEFTQLVSAV